jgi:hypothetical protein
MNQDHDKLLEILEQATAPRSEPEGRLDSETASLREGWLALGQLLEGAEPSAELPMPLPTLRPARKRGWHLAIIAAVAASLLIGMVTAWRFRATNQPAGPSLTPENVAVSDGSANSDVPAAPENRMAAAPTNKTAAPVPSEVKWDDKLDDEIVQVAQAVVGVEQQWAYGADAASFVHYGLEQVEEEMQGGSL